MLPLDGSISKVWKVSIYWYSGTTDVQKLFLKVNFQGISKLLQNCILAKMHSTTDFALFAALFFRSLPTEEAENGDKADTLQVLNLAFFLSA